jgi:hypothetical protein
MRADDEVEDDDDKEAHEEDDEDAYLETSRTRTPSGCRRSSRSCTEMLLDRCILGDGTLTTAAAGSCTVRL